MARQFAKSWEGGQSRRLRKKIEMQFAHLKRILNFGRLRLRAPNDAHDEFLLAATAQNLWKLAKLIPEPNLKPADLIPNGHWKKWKRPLHRADGPLWQALAAARSTTYRYNNRDLDRLTIGITVTADYTYDGLERLAFRTTASHVRF